MLSPYPRMRRVLHLCSVHKSMALKGLLVRMVRMVRMVVLGELMMQNLIMTSRQTARVRVRKMDTLWIITVKLAWKNMKRPQPREN